MSKNFIEILGVWLSVTIGTCSPLQKVHALTNVELEVFMVAFTNASSSWTLAEIEKHIQITKTTFAQCGVDVKSQILVTDQLPLVINKSLQSNRPNSIRSLGAQLPFMGAIRVFIAEEFVEDDRQPRSQTGFARSHFRDDPTTHSLPPPLVDTVWLAQGARNLDSPQCRANYSVMAHEVAHVMTRYGSHNNHSLPNILAVCMLGKRNHHVLAEDCELVRQHPLVRRKP